MIIIYVRIPNQIDIIGVTYDVEYVEKFEGYMVARIDYRANKIQIDKTLGESMAFQTFIHELTHGIFIALNIDKNSSIVLNEDMVERVSQIYSQIFKQILSYNMEPDYLDELLLKELDEIDRDKLDLDSNFDDVKVEPKIDMMIS